MHSRVGVLRRHSHRPSVDGRIVFATTLLVALLNAGCFSTYFVPIEPATPIELARQVWPTLTTIHQPTARIAASAIGLLVDRLDDRLGDRKPEELHPILDVRLVQRESTRPPPCI